VQLMTQAEFARHRGVSKPAVTGWKKKNLLVMAEDPADGRIKVDVARSDARINARVDPMRGRPPGGSAVPTTIEPPAVLPLEERPQSAPSPSSASALSDERVEHLREQRIGTALKNAQLAGDLVPLVEAERRVSEIGRAARERMQAWLRGIAERFAATSDLRTIMALGEEGIDAVFAELADAAAGGAFAGEDEAELTAEERAELEAAAEEQ